MLQKKTNTSLFLKLYAQCVKPILLYCSEILALERLTTQSQDLEQKYESLGAEKVQLKFCKYLLGVHKSAANNAVRAELCIFPVAIYFLRSSVPFWLHIIQSKNNKLVKISYEDTCNINKGFGNIFRTFFMKLNFSQVWENQGTFSKARLVNAITAKLKDSYTTYWHNLIFGRQSKPH